MDVSERPRGVAAGGHSRSRPGRTRWIALVALGVLVAGGYAIYAARQPSGPAVTVAPGPAAPPGEDPGAASPRSVSVERVEARLLSEPVRVTGVIRSDQTITVSTTATGLIRAVYAREGDRVERGKLLVLLDETERRAQYDRAVAALRAAETRLSQATTQRGIRNAAAEADYRRAEDALRAAGSRAEQARQLAAIADTESGTRVASARAGAQAARERLNALREGSRKQERAAAEAAVQRARTQVERARTALVRRTQLLREGAIAPEVVDNARRDLEVASADLEAARQQLSLVEEGPRTEEIRVAEEALRQAEAAMQDAEANQARRRVSREEVESTVAEVRRAEAARDAARAALASTRWNDDEVRAARAAVGQARADVRYAEEQLRQTRIYSPADGVITQRKAQVGQSVVQMSNELFTLVSVDNLYCEATAPEGLLPFLRVGQAARVWLDSAPGTPLSGALREVIPVAQGTSRAVRLRIALPGGPAGASRVVGGFARAVINGSSRAPVLTVPREAVVSEEGQLAVFILERNRARRRPIQVLDAGGVGTRLAVLSGLSPGDAVIVSGAASLVDGQPVQPG